MGRKQRRIVQVKPSGQDLPPLEIWRRGFEWGMATEPRKRIVWLLEFAAMDLDALSRAERETQAGRLQWCGVHPAASSGDVTPLLQQMPDTRLRWLQGEIRRGLSLLLTGVGKLTRWTGTARMVEANAEKRSPWWIAGPRRIGLLRTSPRFKAGKKAEEVPRKSVFDFQWEWEDNEAYILAGIAHLLQKAGADLRGCKTCGTPFLRTKRQTYCRPRCAQLTRDERKRQAKR